jgi:tRNA(Ile)-lysidine synthase
MAPSPELVERFRGDLDELIAPIERLGIAVSGGPDSMALPLLAAAARPGLVEAATVDHALRPESRSEAEMVADICGRLGIPHEILSVEWEAKPTSAIQERAREARYRLLTAWVRERGLSALATAHHLDDQAETLVMRLLRGAGVRGLAGMRRAAPAPGDDLPLVRPLLSWRHSELEELCRAAGVIPVADPSNADEQFERVRVRRALSEAKWLDPEALALSADYLSEADSALHWATSREWQRAVTATDEEVAYRPDDAPREILRRIARRAVLRLAREGKGEDLRGRELDRLLSALRSGRTMTLRGVLCTGGKEWRFIPAPNRTRRMDNLR